MHPVINIALRAARSAAEQIAHVHDRLDRVNVIEDHDNQLVTSMDLDAERTLIYHLRKAYPEHSIQSRVSGYTEGADKDNTWLIDPIVSNRNFLRGYGSYCVSLALRSGRNVTHGVIINPMTNQEFTASKGDGAQLNASRIRVGKATTLENGLVALDADTRGEPAIMTALLREMLALPAQVRISGCPALDMVHVASGRLDAAWCAQPDPVSMAAAQLILQESGALVGDPQGNPLTQHSRELLFSNPKCFKQLLQIRQSLSV